MSNSQWVWVGRAASVFVFAIAGAWFWFREGSDHLQEIGGYSFSETLPEVIEADGADARVVSAHDDGTNTSIEVLTEGGRVLEHFFGRVCTSGVSGGACGYRKTRGEHGASNREREQAQVRLGDLDAKVVDRLRRESKAHDEVPVGLRGRRWVVATPNGVIANVSGSELHPARSAEERALTRSVFSDGGSR